jgi:hypothetical protein
MQHTTHTADKTELADRSEVMNANTTSECHIIGNVNVTSKHAVIGDHNPIPECAVMRNVCPGHQKIVVTDSRDAPVLFSTAIHRAIFTNRVAMTNLNTRRRIFVTGVLRMPANHATLKDMIVFTKARNPRDDNVILNSGVIANGHVGPNHTKVPNPNVNTDLGSGVNNSGLSDRRAHFCSVFMYFACNAFISESHTRR